MNATVPFAVDLEGVTIAGLRAEAAGKARGLVVALHGGGYDARYWHHPGYPQASLPVLGAALGFDVVAFDRPGYAGSAADSPVGRPLDIQADMILDAIDRIDRELPVFVVGHSMGGILALQMAALDRADRIEGVDVSGVPLRFGDARAAALRAQVVSLVASGATHAPIMPRAARRAAFFGADGSFDPVLVAGGETEHPVPVAEFLDALACPTRLPSRLERITAPVQWTVAEAEKTSEAGQPILVAAQRLLGRSRHVRTAMQSGSGHNISLHHVARAYHLRVFAFFEECLAMRQAASACGERRLPRTSRPGSAPVARPSR